MQKLWLCHSLWGLKRNAKRSLLLWWQTLNCMKWKGSWAPAYRRVVRWTLDQTGLQPSRTVAGVYSASKLLVFYVCWAVSDRRELGGSLVSGQKQLTFIVLLQTFLKESLKNASFVLFVIRCNVVANISSFRIIVGFVSSFLRVFLD